MHQSHRYLTEHLPARPQSGRHILQDAELMVMTGLAQSKKTYLQPELPNDDAFRPVPSVFG